MKKGDIITVMTPVGEYMGKFVSMSEDLLVLDDPRLIVNAPGKEKEFGFAKGIAISGKPNPLRVDIRVWLFITEPDDQFVQGYNRAVTGLVV